MPTPKKTKTVKSSSRTRAQRAGQADMVLPGRRGKAQQDSVINDADEEVYGILLSERRRKGDNTPGVTPRTGVAKKRRT